MVAKPDPVPLKPLTVATASPGYRSDGGVAESGERKQRSDQVQIGGEYGGDEQGHANSAEDNDRLAGGTERPSFLDEVAGYSSTKEISQIRRDKWDPNGEQAISQINAFGNQVNGKPVGDKEPHRIGERFRNDDSPGLPKRQQVAQLQSRVTGQFGVSPVRREHLAFRI